MKLVAPLLLAVSALASTGCLASVREVEVPVIPIAPPGARVTQDAAAGFRRYAAALAPEESWVADARYGARWCPAHAGASFVPFTGHGKWTLSTRPIGAAPAGVPSWESEDASTGGEITAHHGYWVLEEGATARRWCWVPGAEETPARVVWREGGGFVGWAPEAPDAHVDDDVDYEALDWVFTLVAKLLDDAIDKQLLGDDAKDAAAEATSHHRHGHRRERVGRTGPGAARVAAARHELAAYVAAHPTAALAVSERGASEARGAGGGAASGAKSSGSSDDESAKKKAKDKDKKSKDDDDRRTEPFVAMAYYQVMAMDPGPLPVAIAPRFARIAEAGGYGRGGPDRGALDRGGLDRGTAALAARAPSGGAGGHEPSHTRASHGGSHHASSSSSSDKSSSHSKKN